MKITLHPKIIFRVPRFSVNAVLDKSWEDLKAAIALSSNEFYDIIKNVPASEIEKLPIRVKQTIWKYFNRAKYRATPYGGFAGFGICDVTNASDNKLVFANQFLLHSYSDWTLKDELHFSFEDLLSKNASLFSNSSFYQVDDCVRFVALIDGQFQLAEIEYSPDIKSILQLCQNPLEVSKLKDTLNDAIEAGNIFELLVYLLENQLLFSDNHPNIIGQDYFKRLAIPHNPKKKQYIIAERTLIQGQLQSQLFRYVPQLVEKLQKIMQPAEQKMLESFKTLFLQKFEQREVPIMVALDPELGVAYDNLAQITDDEFITKLVLDDKSKNISESSKSVLLKTLMGGLSNELPFFDLEKLEFEQGKDTRQIANTFSMICTVVDDRVFIESFGGNSANTLLGRFSLANDDILNCCQSLAAIERTANPGVLFFDVGYMAEGSVDNINRRQSVNDLQLNILAYDTSPNPLTMDDIYLSVRQGELILRSKKLNKRLIPRIASAYNHLRSDLPVYRLLWELQNQGLQTDLNFSIKNIFPGWNYYPEVRFKNLCVSPRCWKVKIPTNIKEPNDFKKWLSNTGVSQHFKTGKSDQTLTFNREKEEDLSVLMDILRKEHSVFLEEVQLPKQYLATDGNELPYHSQFVMSFTHSKSAYQPLTSIELPVLENQDSIIAIGSDWLYFEIYCHATRADRLLTEKISNYLESNKGYIVKWFFIRYNEGGSHLRLRLHLYQNDTLPILMSGLSETLAKEIISGIVSDVRIRNYRKETERYGISGMEAVENHFHKDSTYVLRILAMQLDVLAKYRLCLDLLIRVRSSAVFDDQSFLKLINHFSNAFIKEHQFGVTEYKALNEQYRSFQQLPFLNSITLHTDLNSLAASMIQTLQQCPELHRGNLLADLLHMHVNRLFSNNQRLHESVIYYFAVKGFLRDSKLASLQRA
nr:lantibiotic dehydratase [Mucilaginibacter sp. L294]